MLIKIFLLLMVGHALADYPLQNDFLAKFKSYKVASPIGTIWPYCLTAHALIHAGAVWAITGSSFLAAIEFVLHWFIDLGKCADLYNFHVDQALHTFCKLLYAALLVLVTLLS